jgi:Rps23 Pro-64 3,4-dihydroxylase Tpa1-like proline 4-hydroxylase
MTIKQIRDYTALVRRRSELVLCSGRSWKPEYTGELARIDSEIVRLRTKMLGDKPNVL